MMSSVIVTELRAFNAVAAETGFSRAAAVLGVGQSTVTKQVQSLEARFGVSLFIRRGRMFKMTPEGRHLRTLSRRLFGITSEVEDFMRNIHGLEHGKLRVGSSVSILAVNIAAAFNKAHSGIELSFIAGTSNELKLKLLDMEVDVAVVAGVETHPELDIIELGTRELVFLTPKDHPWTKRKHVCLKDIESEMLVSNIRGAISDVVERCLTKNGVIPKSVMKVENADTVWQSASNGLGIGILPRQYFPSYAGLQEISLSDVDMSFTEQVISLKGRGSPIVQAFIKISRSLSISNKNNSRAN